MRTRRKVKRVKCYRCKKLFNERSLDDFGSCRRCEHKRKKLEQEYNRVNRIKS